MSSFEFLEIAQELEGAGLKWQPEIGDEVSSRNDLGKVSVLVDTAGMTPPELRESYLWLPTVEQMIFQVEVRSAILFHAGLELSQHRYCYKTVIQGPRGSVEAEADSLRGAFGWALRNLLIAEQKELH